MPTSKPVSKTSILKKEEQLLNELKKLRKTFLDVSIQVSNQLKNIVQSN